MFIDVDNRVFEDIIYHSQDGIWSIDDKYLITAINPAAVELLFKAFGVTFAIGNNINEYGHMVLFKPLLDQLNDALKGNSFTEQESVFISEGERVFETSFSPICKDNNVIGVSVISREITELSYYTRLGKSKFRELQVLNTLSSKIAQANTVDEMVEECTRSVR
ncbi:MAG: PAS domain-containing protein, partial [Anaerolineaceae bacterium]